MDKFKYQPLDLEDQSFRLIQLFRGVLGPIQCNLFHSRFQDAEDVIEYEALSYTWGGNDKAYSIEVNGVETAVTKNLFTALRNLRTPHRDRILWIDAICIDQNSDKERGHQVQQMGTIYKRAEQVVIWLGEATAETDLVFQSVRALEERMIQYACNDWNSRDNRWSEHWSSIQSELEAKYGNLKAQQRKGLNNLLSRPWFKRIWIIQEVANARAATVICGSQSVSARIFSLIIPLIGITPPHHCQAIFDIMPGPARKHSWWMRDRRLHSLLIMFRASEASDQRDIIYALLGISSDGCDSNILRPDYEKSEEEVVQVTLSFLLQLKKHKDYERPLTRWKVFELSQHLRSLGNLVLISAVEDGNQMLVEEILQRTDVDVNCKPDGRELIVVAATTGNDAVVRLLLDNGAECDTLKIGVAAVHAALTAGSGDEKVVKLLLDKGARIADVDRKPRRELFEAALDRPHKQVLKLLFDKVTSIIARKGKQSLVSSFDEQVRINSHTQQYIEATFAAALERGDRHILKLLFEEHESILDWFAISNERFNKGFTNHSMIYKKHRISLVRDPKRFRVEVTLDKIALLAASEMTDEKEVECFMKSLNLNAQQGPYHHALQEAAYLGEEQVVKLLLKRGAPVNMTGGRYGTALQAAIVNGWDRVVTLLLEEGADINTPGGHYGSALQAAVARKRRNIVMQLLERGADVKAQGGKYGSVLQAAVFVNDKTSIQNLRGRGAMI